MFPTSSPRLPPCSSTRQAAGHLVKSLSQDRGKGQNWGINIGSVSKPKLTGKSQTISTRGWKQQAGKVPSISATWQSLPQWHVYLGLWYPRKAFLSKGATSLQRVLTKFFNLRCPADFISYKNPGSLWAPESKLFSTKRLWHWIPKGLPQGASSGSTHCADAEGQSKREEGEG